MNAVKQQSNYLATSLTRFDNLERERDDAAADLRHNVMPSVQVATYRQSSELEQAMKTVRVAVTVVLNV